MSLAPQQPPPPDKTLNILVFIGSSRNEESWTYKIQRIIEEKMNAIRPTKFDYVFIEKTGLPFCDGCLHCVTVGEHSCPDFSIVGPIEKKMDQADGIILASPVRTFAVTGLMKNFAEYFMYKRNRPSFFGKKAVVCATASGGGHKNVMDFLEGTASAWGCDVVTRFAISSSQMLKERYIKLVHEESEDVAQIFVREIENGELGSPKFRHLMNFRAMQNMTRNQKDSVNYRYWKERGWLNAEYYTDVPINPFARFMAGYISRKMRKSTRTGNLKPIR
jgi:multimeric flavodoxin WrbA